MIVMPLLCACFEIEALQGTSVLGTRPWAMTFYTLFPPRLQKPRFCVSALSRGSADVLRARSASFGCLTWFLPSPGSWLSSFSYQKQKPLLIFFFKIFLKILFRECLRHSLKKKFFSGLFFFLNLN